MAFSRAVANLLNGFDERLHTGEDSDFALRAEATGIEVLGIPGMRVTHHGEPATLTEFFCQQLWHMNRAAYGTAIREARGGRGGNALLFTIAFGIAAIVSFSALVLTFSAHVAYLPFVLALPAVVILPALRTCLRAKHPFQVHALSVLYFTYGLARLLKLLGVVRTGRSWRVPSNSATIKEAPCLK
jgi:GT2 family glycosyltransferase